MATQPAQALRERLNAFRKLADAQHPLLFPISIGIGAAIAGSAILLLLTRGWRSKRITTTPATTSKLVLEPSTPSKAAVAVTSIKAAELLAGSEAAIATFCEQLRDHGYAVLVPDAAQIAALQALLLGSGREFFALEQEKKGKSKEVNSLGYSSNLGYVNVPPVREYIKLRPSDPKYLWPAEPASFKGNFDRSFAFLKELAWKCFTGLAQFRPDGKQRVLVQDTVSVLAEFVESKSSISLIHYYPNLPADKMACDEHRDTGILTLIVASETPGLELRDKATGAWVPAEKVAKPWEIVCIIGEKVPSFTRSELFPATLHKVTSTGERLSMAFLLDVAK